MYYVERELGGKVDVFIITKYYSYFSSIYLSLSNSPTDDFLFLLIYVSDNIYA